jgi:SAM-dependent methyltransferase
VGRRLLHGRSAADVWDEQAGTWHIGGVRYWTELRQVQDEINRRVSGDPAVDPYLHLLRTRLADRLPVTRALTIGCGSGELERGLCQYGFAGRHDAFDVAPKAVEKAIAAAREAGFGHLGYGVADGNALSLEPRSYDVVFGVHAIHHIEKLERVFEEVSRALKPDGLFFMNEFVGPTRFQWTDRQLEVVNGLLRALPEELRASTVDGRVKTEVPRPTVAEMIAMDPSEAVRSGEILEVAASYFEILEIRPYGGTVLHLLLHEIAGNFSKPGNGGEDLLAAISAFEWALVEAGHLASDFAVVVARAKRP